MKLKTEICPEGEEELILRAKTRTDRISRLEAALEQLLWDAGELNLTIGNTEFFVPKHDILFFETEENRVSAHTAKNMYFTDKKLYELERLLPSTFMRVSKSCILNVAEIASIDRNLTGASEVTFRNCGKKVFVSRIYYKVLREKIEQMRLT